MPAYGEYDENHDRFLNLCLKVQAQSDGALAMIAEIDQHPLRVLRNIRLYRQCQAIAAQNEIDLAEINEIIESRHN